MNRINKGFTLIELLISICLLAVMVLGFSSINLFTNFQVISSDRRAKLQNEASLALEHMAKNMSQAIGDANDVPFQSYADNRGIKVRWDKNPNGKVDGSDIWIGYRHENSQIIFFPDASVPGVSEVISNRIVITNDPTSPESPTNPWGLKIDIPVINQFDITVRARWDPAASVSVDNPEVILKTTVLAPSVSVK